MCPTGSYEFENLESRHLEKSFLAERTRMRLEGFPDLLRRHGYPPAGRVLEVGTAQGVRAKLMARHFPNSSVVGLDRSAALLKVARENLEESNLSFVEGDLHFPPYPDPSFDFIYARLVFMHLQDPLAAMLSLKRTLRPGGRLLIEDADRDCMFFEPAPASFAGFWNKVQEGQRRMGGNPNIGRLLTSLFKQAAFAEINTELQPIVGDGEEIEFLVRTLMPSLNLYLEPEDRASGESAIRDLHFLAQNPCATFTHVWFAVSGRN